MFFSILQEFARGKSWIEMYKWSNNNRTVRVYVYIYSESRKMTDLYGFLMHYCQLLF